MELNNICPICLRTDRKLKVIPIALSEYHEKITDDTLPFKNYHYCSDCDCLLRKTYNFQQKCTNAAKILENWMNATTTDKPSANMLHLKLPPITLDIWKSTNYKLFDITYAYSLEDPINIEDCNAINPDIDTGTGLNMSEKLNSNEKNDEIKNIETLIQHEKTFKMEFLNEQYQTTEVSDTSFQNFNDVKKIFIIGSEDPINVVKNELLHEDTKDDTIVNTEIADILKIEYSTTNEFENKLSDETEQVNNTCNIDNVEVKREARKPYNKINLYNTIDLNQENHSVSHMLNETHINLPNLADDTRKLNENVDRLTNVSINKTLINYTEVKDLDVICLSDEYSKNDNIIEIDDKNEYPDDASLDSNDDCDDYLHSPPKKTIKKKIILDKLANTDLSDEDLDENYESNINKITHGSRKEKSIISMNKFISTERSLISKLEHMDKTLDSICENWEVTSLFIDKGNTGEQSKDEIKKMTRTFLTRQLLHPRKKNAQSVYVQVGCMNTDLDFIIERCSGTVEDCQDQCSPKERLKTMLKKLPTEDGVALDKDSIIDKLDTVRLSTIKRLLKVMRGKKRLSPDVVKILTNIQNKNVLNKYKSVFDIEHLSTDKEKLEEFERRKTYECYVKAEFKCELCYQGFKTKNHLEYHEKQNHDEMGEFSCRICHVKRKLKKSINTHMTSHCAVYKCKLCPLITHYRDSMINHYEQHKGAIYECDKCFSTYKSKSTLLSHKSIVHSSNNHICTICSGNYYSEDGLKKHMMKKHQGHRNESSEPADVTSVSCEECTINFSSIEAYNKHRSEAHKMTARQNRNPKRTCRVCNMTKSGSAWLKYHYNKMHPDVDFKLQYEKRKEFLCDICGAVYYSQMGLRDHKSRHTGEHRFACDLCPKQFRVAVYLSNHRLYHFPPALVCQHCGKKFHTKSNLFNHLRGHERTVRSHKCQYCQKGFFNIYTLNEHVRGVHYNVRRVRKRGRQETDATGAAGKRSVRAVAKRVKKNASTDESSTDDPSIDECSN